MTQEYLFEKEERNMINVIAYIDENRVLMAF